MNPRGGTELQLEYLYKYVDNKLLDQVQITTSVPEKIPLHPTKLNILWQKNSYDQQNLMPWFKDKNNHHKYDWYVFNSHWNYENFRKVYDLPTGRCLVIKNGIDNITPRNIDKPNKQIRIIHQPTPWRGLAVLLGAMQLVKTDVVLDVYSSTQVYGDAFKAANDKTFEPLYAQAKELPNVNYIGYKPNEYIKEHLKDYDMFVYPSIWEETFCISALESMAAGLYTIVTNYGALYETCAEYGVYVPYDNNYRRLAQTFADVIDQASTHIHNEGVKQHLKSQVQYINHFYNWKRVAGNWNKFLQGALNARKH